MLVTALSQRLDSFNSDDIFSSFLTGHLIFSYIYIFFACRLAQGLLQKQ